MRQLIILFLFLSLQACGQMTITPLMQGFTPSLVLDFTRGTLPVGLTFSRASIATRVNASGNIETVAADQSRFDYDPVTLQARGILIEEARTNFIQNANNPATWSKNNGGTVERVASEFGLDVLLATRGTSGVNSGYVAPIPAFNPSVDGVVTLSVYAKKGTADNMVLQWTNGGVLQYNFTSGTVFTSKYSNVTAVTGRADPVRGGWVRLILTCTYTGSASTAATWIVPGSANESGTVYVAQPQLEQGAFVTSCIPTTNATVTRAADVCSMNVGSWLAPSTGTFIATFLASASNSESIAFLGGNVAGTDFLLYRNGSVYKTHNTDVNITLANNRPYVSNTVASIALSYDATSRTLVSGPIVTSDNRLVQPISGLRFGRNNIGTLNGYIQKVVYYPRRLPNTYLQSLTQ